MNFEEVHEIEEVDEIKEVDDVEEIDYIEDIEGYGTAFNDESSLQCNIKVTHVYVHKLNYKK